MGAFLDKPLTEYIDAEAGEANGLSWGVSSMQGWRTEMEVDETSLVTSWLACLSVLRSDA